jgi:hypothetical protein
MALPAFEGAVQLREIPPPFARLIAVSDIGRPGTVVAVSGPTSEELTDSNTKFLALILYRYLTPDLRPVKTKGFKFTKVFVTASLASDVAVTT